LNGPADNDPSPLSTDVAVVGGGAAGLYVALRAAEHGASVTLVSRKPLSQTASYWAQGGLAAALAPDDSPARHAQDTLNAGRGLCRSTAVDVLTREAPAAVAELIQLGVRFDPEPGSGQGSSASPTPGLALALEGGHSARRIVHAGGAQTGRAITGRLAELVGADERIRVLEETSAVALWSDGTACAGVVTDAGPIAARATVLATGGGAALWSRTTNPWGAIGAGAVLAHGAGAALADLEFCQFHPTALALPGGEHDGTLLTEALRGEGAELLDAAGRRFTDELAPRDQVTAAILDRMEADGSDHVALDLRSIAPDRFPNVFAACRTAGLDPEREPVPVAPAAHYVMGGVVCDLDGATTLPGLFAVGESACSGVHGANRLASNSLSECFVFGARAAAAAAAAEGAQPPDLPTWRFEPPTVRTREAVWRHTGPRRDAESMEPLLGDPYPLARMIARAGMERRESRGPHQRSDHPLQDPELDGVHLLVDPDESVHAERWP
jgi:L-aspartate oxidase